MDLELKTLLPALGVIVGWFLSELSQLLKNRREDRRVINKSLYLLLNLLLILNHKKSLLKSALKSDQLTDVRLEILNRLFEDDRFDSGEVKKKLFQIISDLAEVDPILCQGLTINVDATNIFGKLRNSESHMASRSDLKLKYDTLEVFIRSLEMSIRKLITKHSIFMRIRYEIYRRQNLGDPKVSWDSLFQSME